MAFVSRLALPAFLQVGMALAAKPISSCIVYNRDEAPEVESILGEGAAFCMSNILTTLTTSCPLTGL